MPDDYLPNAFVPHGDSQELIMQRRVSTQNDREQTQHAALTLVFGSLRQRRGQLLNRNPRSAQHTLLLPDGHLLILCCATLSLLVYGCVSAEQNKEVGCPL